MMPSRRLRPVSPAPSAPSDARRDTDRPASPTSDVANAHRLARAYGDALRWTPGLGWIAWTGSRWAARETEALRLASRIGRLIHAEAVQAGEAAANADSERERERLGKQAEDLHRWARESEKEPRVRGALNLARPLLELADDRLDADSLLLNCVNGTLDLRTGELRAHRREDFITRTTGVAYDPNARSDLWDRVIERAIPEPDRRAFVQRLIGNTACGRTGEDVVVVIFGATRTGKGSIQSALASALGEYSITAGLDDLAERERAGGARPELARLRGARMVSIYETSARLRLDAATVKTLAGSDPVTARTLYREPITFVPTFTIWLATNHRPRVPADDDAIWQRLREIRFEAQIPEEERDPAVRRRLTDPADGGPAVLRWIVEGALAYQREGLRQPESVRRSTGEYRAAMSPLGDFVRACCVLHPAAWVKAAELRATYEAWCSESGERPLGGRAFSEALRAQGAEPERRHAGRGWRGVGIAEMEGVTP